MRLPVVFSQTECGTSAKKGEVGQTVQANPVADPRLMRRVIAEDPKWNLETILPLKDVVIKFIIDNFQSELSDILPLMVCLRHTFHPFL